MLAIVDLGVIDCGSTTFDSSRHTRYYSILYTLFELMMYTTKLQSAILTVCFRLPSSACRPIV